MSTVRKGCGVGVLRMIQSRVCVGDTIRLATMVLEMPDRHLTLEVIC